MAETKKPYASSLNVKQCAIYKAGNDDKPYTNLKLQVSMFQYHEDIMWPSYGATMVVTDTAENLISSMPIQGFEKVVLEVEDAKDNTYKYTFRVWTIANRLSADRRQVYTLGLISQNGLINEGVRVNKILAGRTDQIVEEVMRTYLKAEVETEDSQTNMKILPTKKTPFALIRSIQTKSVPKVDAEKDTSKDDEEVPVNTDEEESISDVGEGADKATGSAGYVFFQTRTRYVFKSFDQLCTIGEEPIKGSFTYSPGKTERESTDKIQEILFDQEINIMQKMREGAYSSICCFFNINTGTYTERVYSLADNWDKMVHLGSTNGLPKGQKKLSKYPTRVMSSVINHENWYTGTKPATEDNTNDFIDNQEDYLSQSYARAGIMFNQQLTISLTGHLELSAGDKVVIMIPNQVPDSKRQEPDKNWDPEHSGIYLIKNINHQFHIINQSVYTVLELVRDSYGMIESTVDTK